MSLPIFPNEVHVWLFDVRHESQDKRQLSREQLIRLCAQYWDVDPSQIEFEKNQQGKPSLKPINGKPTLEFNLSHSGSLLGYVFALDRSVGIDIEVHRPVTQMDAMIRKYLPEEEQKYFSGLDEAEKTIEFFKLWVEAEAMAKCMGVGLSQFRGASPPTLQVIPVQFDLAVSAAIAVSGNEPCTVRYFGTIAP